MLSTVVGDELYVFGSNKNVSLGVGDEDDRQFPERIQLRRPDSLLRSFYNSYCSDNDLDEPEADIPLDEIPTMIQERPILIKDVVLSKLHSAILTSDPISNVYVCGVGRGGRLGLGDENTQYRFLPVQGPLADRKVQQIALGQNHTLAVTSNGELWTWGLNTDCQLGYVLPAPSKADEEAMCTIPRQVFGPLKKEMVLGVAASAIHSVAHTGSFLYCWGRNAGQLALMDSDSRSLEVQPTPRKVAASLLSAPIEMVSAIDRATTCLLANHTVWVFTNFGYNLVKLPVPLFANLNLAGTFASRYDPRQREVSYITSGGETIAAVTASGDLFTMHVNQSGDNLRTATSTTNPTKIKGALSQPHCIWDSRKDGVVSVDIGEHGSVFICTQSGAMWNRVKRSKGKSAAFSGLNDAKRKDFKFERVPYLTNCVAARSSTFGAFAALRKNSRVMAEEIKIQDQTLWSDIGSLLSFSTFMAPAAEKWEPGRPKDVAVGMAQQDSILHQVLGSDDFEQDLQQWLKTNELQFSGYDMNICSSMSSAIQIPVHGWVLTARSPVLRSALANFSETGIAPSSTIFSISKTDGKVLVTFLGLDIYTLINIVIFSYLDDIIPVWKYTREMPAQAYRFRQVRVELMKTATAIRLPKLEAAARLQTVVEPSLDIDLQSAIEDARFFHDADITIELDGDEVHAHSQLLCQRCPFFEGMFYGRSGGQWLASRRQSLRGTDKLRVDLKHMRPESFRYVFACIYGDTGSYIFDDVCAPDIDEFSELVLDVMSAANELMLDRLSQICQSLLGKFVTTRNISLLLNEISPCSVSAFKDTGLEYICLQLESMLENHLLDDLEDDLSLELDLIARDNQLSHFPFVRSGRAELLLHERYPDLAADIEEERRVRIKEMAFKAAHRDDDKKLSSSFKTRFGSFDDLDSSPVLDRTRRKSKPGQNESFSPMLRPRKSVVDMIFDMEDDAAADSPRPRALDEPIPLDDGGPHASLKPRHGDRGKNTLPSVVSPLGSIPSTPLTTRTVMGLETPPRLENQSGSKSGAPWAATTFSASKLDLKGIMSETGSGSALSAGLAAQKAKDLTNSTPKSQTKLSQKERKRQLQAQAESQAAVKVQDPNSSAWEKAPSSSRSAPWNNAVPAPKTSMEEIVASDVAVPAMAAAVKPLVASEANGKSSKLRTASPDTRFSGQGRANSTPTVPSSSAPRQSPKPVMPHSQSYMKPAPKATAELGLSMTDIIGQQRREQELVKEAVAKRSLQEIQQEQAFQEWWDQESQRAQEEETRRQTLGRKQDDKTSSQGRRGRGGRPRVNDGGNMAKSGDGSPAAKAGEQPKKNRGTRGRGRKA